MKRLAVTAVLLLVMLYGITGCREKIEEAPPPPEPSPPAGGAALPFSSASGLVLNLPETTSEEILHIPGNAGPGQRLFINEDEVLTGPDGSFTARINLVPGDNSLSIKVVSMDQKAVYATAKSVRYVPSGNPRLEVTIPEEYQAETEMMIVQGTTDPGCRVDANGIWVTPDENGGFIAGMPLKTGDNIVKITSTNPKGKTSMVQQVVTFNKLNNKQPTLIVAAPEPDKDGFISSERITISGFTEPNNLIEIYNNYYNDDTSVQSLVFKGTAKNGQFSADVTLSQDGYGVNDLLIVATNEHGLTTSETRTVIYKETP